MPVTLVLAPFFPQPATKLSPGVSRRALGALAIVALVVPYVVVNLMALEPFIRYAMGLVLAHAALSILVWAGLPRVPTRGKAISLRFRSIRGAGFTAFSMVLGALMVALLLDRGCPIDWIWVGLYAPASALAQELYFRGWLLTALDELWPDAPDMVVALQAGLFAVWHVRAFLEAAAVVALLFVAGTFVAGLGWGTLVRRQGSLASSIVTHTLVLVGWDALLLLQGQPIQ